ncbi:MAG: HlyD family efflux transporter periplasmic adaptor subunit [Leeuwenhoekiella sp.]
MLNITHNKLNETVMLTGFDSGKKTLLKTHYKYFNRFLLAFSIVLVLILFLPWTQTITTTGNVTTLTPDQRPQTVQSPIPGRIEKWYVQEGDSVVQGDTILFISEIKNEYFDPDLVDRTGVQIDAKERSVKSYAEKVKALNNQIGALRQERELKLEQAQNKLKQARLKAISDSIDLEAVKTNLFIAERQFERTEQLREEGLKSQVDLEDKRAKLQEMQAKRISQENKLLTSQNEIINAKLEISTVSSSYTDKISKAQSDLYSAESNQLDSEVQVSKLETDFTNYSMRKDMYYIKAPQSGLVNKAIIGGIGETFKEGQPLVDIMPINANLAVEMFVRPIDLPLVHLGEQVRVQFDGWPAIVFSGWPNVSYGTYGANVVAIGNTISPNGKYRILLRPDTSDHDWPKGIQVGSGVYAIALLEDVPIWYELWRKLNGFPANFYQPEGGDKSMTKDKK